MLSVKTMAVGDVKCLLLRRILVVLFSCFKVNGMYKISTFKNLGNNNINDKILKQVSPVYISARACGGGWGWGV